MLITTNEPLIYLNLFNLSPCNAYNYILHMLNVIISAVFGTDHNTNSTKSRLNIFLHENLIRLLKKTELEDPNIRCKSPSTKQPAYFAPNSDYTYKITHMNGFDT